MATGFAQNTYARYTGTALEGLLVDLSPNNKASYTNANGTVVDFGLAVVQGSGDRLAVLPSAQGQSFVGITVRDTFREMQVVGGSTTFYFIGDTMTVMTTLGVIWVLPEVDVNVGDPVYFRFAVNGGFTRLGAFRNDANTTLGVAYADLVSRARFNSTATAGNPAQIIIPLNT